MTRTLPTDEQLRRLILDAPDVVAILEADLTVRFVCRSVREALGFSPEEMEGSNLRAYLDPEESGDAFLGLGHQHGELVASGPKSFEVGLRHRDGSRRRFDASVVDRVEDPVLRGIAVYLRDVTGRRAHEERLAYQALHDGLTGLPNRTLFLDRLERALHGAAREGEPVAILFLDLDGFKSVNDSLGHAAGDRLLVAFGRRVRSCLRPGDTVARLGGDEFAVLIEESARDAARVAERIREALREPLDVGGRSVRVSASLGLAVSSDSPGSDRPEDLLCAADAAMYRVKKGRARGGFEHATVTGEVCPGLADGLRFAIEHDGVGPCYQAVESPSRSRRSRGWAATSAEASPCGGRCPDDGACGAEARGGTEESVKKERERGRTS